jgi:hypothetical protein
VNNNNKRKERMNVIEQLKAARRVSVPLVIWKTPDPASTIEQIAKSANGAPLVQWDIVNGVRALNEKAKVIIKSLGDDTLGQGNPLEALAAAQKMPKDTLFFMHNAHAFVENSSVVQAIWNLRDSNKSEHRMLVMLTPQMRTPMELANDVVVIDEALPNADELSVIVKAQVEQAQIGAKEAGKKLVTPDVEITVDALSGLSQFAAEQTVAMSFELNGDKVQLNSDTLWARKRQAIEETRGLTVWRAGETLEDVKGCYNVKSFINKLINGRTPPRAIVFVDEIEKSLSGVAGDTSGTSQDQLATLLKEMQDKKAHGTLFIGHPGSAKSMIAKATGASAGIVTIALDLGAMKGSLVGESERNIRQAMKVIDSVSAGRPLYIATCNQIGALPPELLRRFTLGTFFFDLPTTEERAEIWKAYLKKFDLKDDPNTVNHEGWTGADIFNCAQRAWMFKCSLAEAAEYATPVCKTAPLKIEALRNLANGAFISASYAGLYQKPGTESAKPGPAKRKMSFAS